MRSKTAPFPRQLWVPDMPYAAGGSVHQDAGPAYWERLSNLVELVVQQAGLGRAMTTINGNTEEEGGDEPGVQEG
jgi:hypothetical protein